MKLELEVCIVELASHDCCSCLLLLQLEATEDFLQGA